MVAKTETSDRMHEEPQKDPEPRRSKRYVEVVTRYDTAGGVTPLSITWDDGRVFEITRILDVRSAASLRVGGRGTRYLCRIGEGDSFLYFEDPAWFVEEKRS